jgi:hypothetical protein
MALTPDLSTITLTGTYVDLQGNPVSGSVTFTPQSIIKDTDQNQIIINATISATLNGSGSFSVVLPVTDDTDTAPIPFAYAVEEVFAGGRSFFITIPAGGASTQDIADLAPAVSGTEAVNFVTQSQYNTMFTRHAVALANYNQIDDIAATITLAETYAVDAATALADTEKAALNQFVLMGL